ncbi:hypothetical protein DPMN_087257 [Dreissena polymorpha]|uniref:Uncharacterized protein n=1 Tax=Dreissena polymorpha TaxID=45954 RepID=A0A9D4KRW5_DREPO|nr:hypothetical protein DPMN_087257 [Dreissena polymorpha]
MSDQFLETNSVMSDTKVTTLIAKAVLSMKWKSYAFNLRSKPERGTVQQQRNANEQQHSVNQSLWSPQVRTYIAKLSTNINTLFVAGDTKHNSAATPPADKDDDYDMFVREAHVHTLCQLELKRALNTEAMMEVLKTVDDSPYELDAQLRVFIMHALLMANGYSVEQMPKVVESMSSKKGPPYVDRPYRYLTMKQLTGRDYMSCAYQPYDMALYRSQALVLFGRCCESNYTGVQNANTWYLSTNLSPLISSLDLDIFSKYSMIEPSTAPPQRTTESRNKCLDTLNFKTGCLSATYLTVNLMKKPMWEGKTDTDPIQKVINEVSASTQSALQKIEYIWSNRMIIRIALSDSWSFDLECPPSNDKKLTWFRGCYGTNHSLSYIFSLAMEYAITNDVVNYKRLHTATQKQNVDYEAKLLQMSVNDASSIFDINVDMDVVEANGGEASGAQASKRPRISLE